MGRAIVRQPKAFLFDEPLSNLDAKMRVQMRTEIIKLHQRLASTMIYVTHDQVEAMTMGDRIVVMKDGVIQQVDAPMDLYHRPANLFVAGFIGSPPMNIFPGRVDMREGRPWFVEPSFAFPLDPRHADALVRRAGGDVTFGIRPEAVLEDGGDSPHPALVARVEVVERMGSETLVHLRAGERPFIAKFGPHARPRPGDALPVRLDLARARFFDTASGDAVA